mmetsp:Transcript_113011/g.314504  ORF Transcript_113011/g.314504 Transcript_113011/m.314504 type:complete len:294 (-) Transcript_113011:814-1695(-)
MICSRNSGRTLLWTSGVSKRCRSPSSTTGRTIPAIWRRGNSLRKSSPLRLAALALVETPIVCSTSSSRYWLKSLPSGSSRHQSLTTQVSAGWHFSRSIISDPASSSEAKESSSRWARNPAACRLPLLCLSGTPRVLYTKQEQSSQASTKMYVVRTSSFAASSVPSVSSSRTSSLSSFVQCRIRMQSKPSVFPLTVCPTSKPAPTLPASWFRRQDLPRRYCPTIQTTWIGMSGRLASIFRVDGTRQGTPVAVSHLISPQGTPRKEHQEALGSHAGAGGRALARSSSICACWESR